MPDHRSADSEVSRQDSLQTGLHPPLPVCTADGQIVNLTKFISLLVRAASRVEPKGLQQVQAQVNRCTILGAELHIMAIP